MTAGGSINRDTSAARRFHAATSYTLVGSPQDDDSDILMGTPPDLGPAIGEQDPAIEPYPFKVYETLDTIPLPADPPAPATPWHAALAGNHAAGGTPNLADIARICLLSNGILKRGQHGTGREILYRAAGGTGARYHLELYLACTDLDGLAAGLYHYDAREHALRRLRAGDHRAALVEASGGEPRVAQAPAVLIATSTFWRNAWRYQARAYRHVWWDLGTTLANVLAVAESAALASEVVLGFADEAVNRLLDVDGEREAAVALVPLGGDGPVPVQAPAPELAPLGYPTRPLSAREIVFPDLVAMHHASSLAGGAEAAQWRARALHRALPDPAGELTPLQPLAPEGLSELPIDAVIRRRRSTRYYAVDTPIPFDATSTLLAIANRPVAIDALDPAAPPLNDMYLIVNNVAGVEPGSYLQAAGRDALERLARGSFRQEAALLACAQEYAGEAHVDVYWLADLAPILDQWGNRGYRLAQLEASIRAGRLHLATHALGLGAVGSTSVDDEVTRFFSPHAAGKSFMFVLVFGKKRPRDA